MKIKLKNILTIYKIRNILLQRGEIMEKEYCLKCGNENNPDNDVCECGGRNFVWGDDIVLKEKLYVNVVVMNLHGLGICFLINLREYDI